MDVRLREYWDSLRSSYWFVPTVMTAGAVISWAVIDALNHHLHATATLPIPWLYNASLDAARTLLLAVAGAMVGISGVVFSIRGV